MTETDVANMALALLEEAPITDIDDDNTAARLCKTHFEITRKGELVAHDWDFAVKTDDLTGVDTDSGSGTLNWEYTLPADNLRVLPLTYDNTRHGVPISWEVREGKLYSDQETPRGIRYIADIEDPTNWPPLFVEVVAAALAVKLAHPLTHKAGMIKIAQGAYERALNRALRTNNQHGRLYDASWAYQRGDTRYWRA